MDSFIRDTAVATPLELEDEDLLITFVPHHEALNHRTTTFDPEIWLMYFGFPYDYQTDYYVNKSLGGFGALVSWYNPRQDRRFMLIKARVLNVRLFPKSFVVWQLGGPEIAGLFRSQSSEATTGMSCYLKCFLLAKRTQLLMEVHTHCLVLS